MSLLNYLEQNEYSAALGMDTTSPLMNVREGFARLAYNCNLGLTSGWIKRNGYTRVNSSSAWSTRNIVAGTEFRKSNGDLITVLFGQTAGGTTGVLGSVAAGGTSVSTIASGYADTVRPSFAQFSGRLFMYNGVDDGVLYDGTGTRQVGISAPIAAPTYVSTGTGDLPAGNFLYVYTYYNSVTKAESSPSPASVIIGGPGGESYTIALTAGDSATADKIVIYRTGANGNQFFYEGEVGIAVTSFVSTLADEELAEPLELDNSRLADVTTAKGKFAVVAQNRVFVVTDRNEVRYSALGYSGPMPESFQVKAVVSTVGTYGDGDDIVGLGNIGELPVVVKRRSIGILQPLDLPAFNSEVDTQGYRYIEISDSVGGVAHHAGGQVEGEYVFLGRDMVWATNGQQVRPIAQPIQATIRSLGWASTQVQRVSFGNDPKNRRIYLQVFENSISTTPSITLVGDYQQYPNFRWTLYSPGNISVTHPGISAGCFINVTNSVNGSIDTWFGNVANNGRVYLMNSGTNDDGHGIYFKLVTRPYDLNQPNHLKLYKQFRAQVQGDGSDYSLTMAPLFDMSPGESVSISKSLEGEGAEWDSGLWDAGTWLNDGSIQVQYSAHRKARFMQLSFVQDGQDAPLTVYGWAASGSIFQH